MHCLICAEAAVFGWIRQFAEQKCCNKALIMFLVCCQIVTALLALIEIFGRPMSAGHAWRKSILALQCFSSAKPCQPVPFAPVNCVCMQPNLQQYRTVACMHCPQHVHSKCMLQHHPAMHLFAGADCVQDINRFQVRFGF